MQKILIIQTAFIGDVILATSVIEKLQFHLPDARLDFLLRKGNESLFAQHPYIHKVWVWEKKRKKYRSLWSLLRAIREEKYDVVINLQRFSSSGFLAGFSGASVRVGFDKNPLARLCTHIVPHDIMSGKHEIERNNALTFPLTKSDKLFKPKLYPSNDDYAFIQEYLIKPYITISPTSVWFTKQFPIEKWIAFLQKLTFRGNIYLLGGNSDIEMCKQIADAVSSQKVEVLAGKLSLLQSAALMEYAIMNYVNDSAPLHLASAMNAPTTAIFCSTVPTFGFTPLADDSVVIETLEYLACRPCGLHGYRKCPEEHFRCAQSIDVEHLVKRISFE